MAEKEKKVIEAEIVNDTIQMKEEPEKISGWQKLKNGVKKHWKKVLFTGLSIGATGAGAYLLGKKNGTKAALRTNTVDNNDGLNYLEEGENNPEV